MLLKYNYIKDLLWEDVVVFDYLLEKMEKMQKSFRKN